MEAIILLLISACLLSAYGFIYVSLRLARKVRKDERRQFKTTFIVLLFILLISGSSAAMLVLT
ncbi:hypothetical protein [Halalkalibacter nanhaiisediminis]|uniref:Uncharacterized protein n=1 Tax=Halalkalibacter nanhaiisediminis TaxID=688079 RepID=A0A562QHI7_9BACI|nr:hypothetical protein [Halalkalibacter nanhaiisediminis]TWI56217.1 hypothetical protein IQ10_02108 [Halalkalibacter nanhaiisediminis]